MPFFPSIFIGFFHSRHCFVSIFSPLIRRVRTIFIQNVTKLSASTDRFGVRNQLVRWPPS